MERLRQELKDTKLSQAAYKISLSSLKRDWRRSLNLVRKVWVFGDRPGKCWVLSVLTLTGMAVNALGPLIRELLEDNSKQHKWRKCLEFNMNKKVTICIL